jgi:hypothetical protein
LKYNKPPKITAPAIFANYAYDSIIFVMAVVYFLVMAMPMFVILVILLGRKTNATYLNHVLASKYTKHRWPNDLEWSTARRKIISRAKKKSEHTAPVTPLVLCHEDWNCSTDVINLDKANWFLLGMRGYYIAAILHQMILLQCMTGWSIILAKATYSYFMRRPKKPPKPNTDQASVVIHSQNTNYEQPVSNSPQPLCCIACSTDSAVHDEPCEDWFKANFGEAEEQHLVGLDNMCSRHLFSDPNDFIGDILPIDPLEICGVAGGFRAKGEGTVRG